MINYPARKLRRNVVVGEVLERSWGVIFTGRGDLEMLGDSRSAPAVGWQEFLGKLAAVAIIFMAIIVVARQVRSMSKMV
jgi:hypothetical protein